MWDSQYDEFTYIPGAVPESFPSRKSYAELEKERDRLLVELEDSWRKRDDWMASFFAQGECEEQRLRATVAAAEQRAQEKLHYLERARQAEEDAKKELSEKLDQLTSVIKSCGLPESCSDLRVALRNLTAAEEERTELNKELHALHCEYAVLVATNEQLSSELRDQQALTAQLREQLEMVVAGKDMSRADVLRGTATSSGHSTDSDQPMVVGMGTMGVQGWDRRGQSCQSMPYHEDPAKDVHGAMALGEGLVNHSYDELVTAMSTIMGPLQDAAHFQHLRAHFALHSVDTSGPAMCWGHLDSGSSPRSTCRDGHTLREDPNVFSDSGQPGYPQDSQDEVASQDSTGTGRTESFPSPPLPPASRHLSLADELAHGEASLCVFPASPGPRVPPPCDAPSCPSSPSSPSSPDVFCTPQTTEEAENATSDAVPEEDAPEMAAPRGLMDDAYWVAHAMLDDSAALWPGTDKPLPFGSPTGHMDDGQPIGPMVCGDPPGTQDDTGQLISERTRIGEDAGLQQTPATNGQSVKTNKCTEADQWVVVSSKSYSTEVNDSEEKTIVIGGQSCSTKLNANVDLTAEATAERCELRTNVCVVQTTAGGGPSNAASTDAKEGSAVGAQPAGRVEVCPGQAPMIGTDPCERTAEICEPHGAAMDAALADNRASDSAQEQAIGTKSGNSKEGESTPPAGAIGDTSSNKGETGLFCRCLNVVVFGAVCICMLLQYLGYIPSYTAMLVGAAWSYVLDWLAVPVMALVACVSYVYSWTPWAMCRAYWPSEGLVSAIGTKSCDLCGTTWDSTVTLPSSIKARVTRLLVFRTPCRRPTPTTEFWEKLVGEKSPSGKAPHCGQTCATTEGGQQRQYAEDTDKASGWWGA